MKVYLGGKMSGHDKSNWREDIVDGGVSQNYSQGEYFQVDGAVLGAGCGMGEPPENWPTLHNAILNKHDYVGPYLVSCDHGCYHTGDHATSIAFEGESKSERNENRHKIRNLCLAAMGQADVLFFWIDSLDAYGTFAELMLCSCVCHSGDTGQRIFVASPSFAALDEMWLGFSMLINVTAIEKPTPKEALVAAMTLVDDGIEYSPIERMFIDKWRAIYSNAIVPQYNVPGFRYRVDFAFPDEKVAVELDGYEYHNSKEQFTNDRKRQREMEVGGWRFIRFSGSEVYSNAETCVNQAYEFWQSLKL